MTISTRKYGFKFGWLMGDIHNISKALHRVKHYSQDQLDTLNDKEKFGDLSYEYYLGYYMGFGHGQTEMSVKARPQVDDKFTVLMTEQEYNFVLYVLKNYLLELDGANYGDDYFSKIHIAEMIPRLEQRYKTLSDRYAELANE